MTLVVPFVEFLFSPRFGLHEHYHKSIAYFLLHYQAPRFFLSMIPSGAEWVDRTYRSVLPASMSS